MMENNNVTYALSIKNSDKESFHNAVAKLYQSEFTGIEEKPTEMVFHYSEEADMEEALESIKPQSKELQIDTTSIENQNWNALWEAQYPDVVIGDLCQIRADFHEENTDVEHSILISPRMSFGTGHHPTTALMIEGMAEIKLKDKSVLDVGTGTGVLAILADMRGAKRIIGVEILPYALENARDNGALNQANVEWILGEITDVPEGSFDVVLANINKNALIKICSQLANRCAKGGYMLLSGFYERDVADLRAIFEPLGLKYQYQKTEQDWTLLVFKG